MIPVFIHETDFKGNVLFCMQLYFNFHFAEKTGSLGPQHIYMAVLSLLVTSLFSFIMIMTENVPALMRSAREDIRVIESVERLSATGRLTVERFQRSLPGSYRDGVPRPFTRATLTQGRDSAAFLLSNDIMRIVANETARYFQVTYTPNFRVVIDIMPIEAP